MICHNVCNFPASCSHRFLRQASCHTCRNSRSVFPARRRCLERRSLLLLPILFLFLPVNPYNGCGWTGWSGRVSGSVRRRPCFFLLPAPTWYPRGILVRYTWTELHHGFPDGDTSHDRGTAIVFQLLVTEVIMYF